MYPQFIHFKNDRGECEMFVGGHRIRFTANIVPDNYASPTDYYEEDSEEVKNWEQGNYCYVGVTISWTLVNAPIVHAENTASLWAIEYSDEADNRYCSMVAHELIEEVTATIEKELRELSHILRSIELAGLFNNPVQQPPMFTFIST